MKIKLSTLNKVELRDAWPHEARDFTEWLSQQENLDLLSQVIGVNIKLIAKEAAVGSFSVDILAEDEINRKIIIENQLESTDHDHLGKIITYAAGHDAEIIIWIVRDVKKEHQSAIEWLNEHTDEKISFFLIKIELWQIENSPAAPKLEIISSPNEWAKSIRFGSRSRSDTKLQQLDFWSNFKIFANKTHPNLQLQSPRPQNWYNINIGTPGAHIVLSINTRENFLRCSIYVGDNKELYDFLNENSNAIETELNDKAQWNEDDKGLKKSSTIEITNSVDNVLDHDSAERHFNWLLEKALLFQRVFVPYIKKFER